MELTLKKDADCGEWELERLLNFLLNFFFFSVKFAKSSNKTASLPWSMAKMSLRMKTITAHSQLVSAHNNSRRT